MALDQASSKICKECGERYSDDALFCPADGSLLASASSTTVNPPDPYLGQQVTGNIELRQLVGIGAMGRVYRAYQHGIDRDVAVKILHRELSADAQLVTRFTREAKVASRLAHPNVVQVLLTGQLPNRALYMVMEFLDGVSLQGALAAAGGSLSLDRAMHIALQLCDAVGEAHTQGIVHRDLKPENVMLVRRGADPDFVKVLDFGIARMSWGEPSLATSAGLVFGTARYISPEGAQGNPVGPAGDVYSIATLLYQLLSGRTPFDGDQALGLLVQQIHAVPPPLQSLADSKHIPEPIAKLIMANLCKVPAERQPDANAFGRALRDALGRARTSVSEPSFGERTMLQAPPRDSAFRPGIETAKWEPPAEFRTRFAEPLEPSGSSSASPRTELSEPHASPFTPLVPLTPTPAPSTRRANASKGLGSVAWIFVGCFLLGAGLAAAFAWTTRQLGARGEAEALPVHDLVDATVAERPSEPEPPSPSPAPSLSPEPAPTLPRAPVGPAPKAAPAGNSEYKALLELSGSTPRLGERVQLTARVVPSAGAFESPAFTVVTPGAPGGRRLSAESSAPGVFTTSYVFSEAGSVEVTFSVTERGRPITTKRVVVVTGAIPPLPPHSAPAGSVKWM